MIRPPPRSPLFPYTPLSRSVGSFSRRTIHPPRGFLARARQLGRSEQSKHKLRSENCVSRFRIQPGGQLCGRSEEHTSELQSQSNLVCRLLLEKKKLDAHNVI